MKDKKLFIFDFDGVLVDSVEVTFCSIINAAKLVQVKTPSFQLLRENWGVSFERDLFPKLAKELSWTFMQQGHVLRCFLESNEKLIYPLPEHLFDFLNQLKAEKKDLAILSNRTLETLIYRSHQHEIDLEIFKHLVCANNGLAKPNPKVFDYFWEKGYKPKEAVFIGDSIKYDLEAAKNHKPEIDFLAVSSGLHSKSEFKQFGLKDYEILDSPVEIEKFF